jgi:peptidoglycan hydrolase CwlO-like protein
MNTAVCHLDYRAFLSKWSVRIVILSTILFVFMAHAAEDKDKELKDAKEQVRKLQQKVKSLEQEKSQLSVEKSKIETDLTSNSEKIEKSNRSLSANNKKITTLEADIELLKNTLIDLQARNASSIQEIVSASNEKIRELQQILSATQQQLNKTLEVKKNLEGSLGATETALTSSQQTIAECINRNQVLYKTGVTLLKKYDEKSCMSSILEKEPLTKLKRVGAENRFQEYQEILEKEFLVDPEAEKLKKMAQKRELEKSEEEKRLKQEEDKKAEAKAQQTKVKEKKRKEQKEINSMTRSMKNSIDRLEW